MTKRIRKSHNIFYYVGIYYGIVLLIVLVLGGYLFRYVYKTVYADFMLGNEQHLTAIVNRHENDMQIVDNIVKQIELSDEVTGFTLREESGKAGELMKQLKGYTSVSQFFDLLFYHYHEDDYLYHESSSMSLENFEKYGCVLNDWLPGQWEELLKKKSRFLYALPEQPIYGGIIQGYLDGEESYTFWFRTIPPKLEETLMFIVPDTYYDELLGDSVFGTVMDYIIYEDQVIVSRGSIEQGADVLTQLVLGIDLEEKITDRKILQEQISVEQTSGKQEGYLMTAQKGGSGLQYVTLQPMENFHDKIQTEQWVVILLILLCLFPAGLLALAVSKNLLGKVKSLNQLLNEDSYYDLNSIGNGIESLISTYQASEKESLVLKRTRFVRDFVRGRFLDRESAIANAKQANLQIDRKWFCLALVKNRQANNEDQTYSMILEAIGSEAAVEGYGIHLVNNNQNLFALFGDSTEAIDTVLENMMEIVKCYCEDYVIAVSDYHYNFDESPKAYLEADTAFDNRLLLDNSKIIRFGDVAQKEHLSLIQESDLQRLRSAIRTSNKDAVVTAVDDICGKIAGENASLYAFRLFYNDIIHILISEWKENQERINNFYNIFTLSQCLNINDFKSLLCEICMLIIESQTDEDVSGSDIVQEAISYMQLNYQDPNLTMKGLAEHLGISSVTLSVEFKNEMDISPSGYLSNLRIEKAKELLLETDMLIKEVRSAVGYYDERVFERHFKKNTGMSPGQYRKR